MKRSNLLLLLAGLATLTVIGCASKPADLPPVDVPKPAKKVDATPPAATTTPATTPATTPPAGTSAKPGAPGKTTA